MKLHALDLYVPDESPFIFTWHWQYLAQNSRFGFVTVPTSLNGDQQTFYDVWPSPGLVHYIYFLQRAPSIMSRAAIVLDIGPHFSCHNAITPFLFQLTHNQYFINLKIPANRQNMQFYTAQAKA